MSKWCYNYDSGKYEYIDKDGYSYDQGEYSTTGMTANTAVKKMKKNDAVKKRKTMIGKS